MVWLNLGLIITNAFPSCGERKKKVSGPSLSRQAPCICVLSLTTGAYPRMSPNGLITAPEALGSFSWVGLLTVYFLQVGLTLRVLGLHFKQR
jgi:hypothetical protein